MASHYAPTPRLNCAVHLLLPTSESDSSCSGARKLALLAARPRISVELTVARALSPSLS
jgi:hypothetical protein